MIRPEDAVLYFVVGCLPNCTTSSFAPPSPTAGRNDLFVVSLALGFDLLIFCPAGLPVDLLLTSDRVRFLYHEMDPTKHDIVY